MIITEVPAETSTLPSPKSLTCRKLFTFSPRDKSFPKKCDDWNENDGISFLSNVGTYICPIALFWDRTLFFTILFWFDLAILVCILHRADGRSCPRSRLSLITRPWGTSPANNEPQKKMPRKSWWPSINDFPLSCTGQFFKSLTKFSWSLKKIEWHKGQSKL